MNLNLLYSQSFLALNQSLARTVIESDEIEIDTIDTGAEDPSKLEAARKEAEKAKNLQTLFKGTKNPFLCKNQKIIAHNLVL